MNSFLCFQLEAGGRGGQTWGEGSDARAGQAGKTVVVCFVCNNKSTKNAWFVLPKAAHTGDGASRSPPVSPGIIGYKISEEENEWRPTSKYFYNRTTNMQIASSWEF